MFYLGSSFDIVICCTFIVLCFLVVFVVCVVNKTMK
jgi:hypothetical protein